MSTSPCPQCGAKVPGVEGPVHAYVPSSPGCWATFGGIQADEMSRFGYPDVHRLVVDAYMAQHPGDGTDRRDRQSVFVHLLSLCAVLERDVPPARSLRLLEPALRQNDDYPVLKRGDDLGALTVLHMAGAADLQDYERRAHEWAAAVWEAWRSEHERIRAALTSAI